MTESLTAPQESSERLADVPFLGAARWTLIAVGWIYVLMGVVAAPLMYGISLMDPSIPDAVGKQLGIGIGAFTLVAFGGVGAFNIVVAWGLGRGAKWAWFAALVIGALYLASICLPFGGIILYGVLNERARDVFLGGRAST